MGVADLDGLVLVRDSRDPADRMLAFTTKDWHAFVGGANKGQSHHFGKRNRRSRWASE